MQPVSPYRQLALAILDAEEAASGSPDAAARVANELRTRLFDMGQPKFLLGIVGVLVSVVGLEQDESPRTVYESMFSLCPTDSDWQVMAAQWREWKERQDG